MWELVEYWAEKVGLRPNAVLAVVATCGLLLIGSLGRIAAVRRSEVSVRSERLGSLLSWWLLYGFFALAIVAGPTGGLVLLALVSLLGVREFLKLASKRTDSIPGQWIAYASVPLSYFCIYMDWQVLFGSLVPVFIFLGMPTRMVLTGKTAGFLHAVGSLSWGVVLLVFCFAHAGRFLTLEDGTNPVAGAAGWFFFVVVLTQINDIAQAQWGRRIGKRKITPRISPNKTWEGFLFGVGTTVVVSGVAAPLLTPLAESHPPGLADRVPPLPYAWALLAGLLIGISGFLGDLTMSAVKRDTGVKDSGTMLPGQGGILDRIDSLTFTAPLFYYYVYWLYPSAAP